MDSKLYLERAENELKLADILFSLSATPNIQKEIFNIKDPETYYSAVISHSYYTIFYATKAYLSKKGIKVKAPEEHKKAYDAFKVFVDNGELDVALLKIYKEAILRAEVLLGIFKEEKQKRGKFTYRTIPQANKDPAKESMQHAAFFFKNIHLLHEE